MYTTKSCPYCGHITSACRCPSCGERQYAEPKSDYLEYCEKMDRGEYVHDPRD